MGSFAPAAEISVPEALVFRPFRWCEPGQWVLGLRRGLCRSGTSISNLSSTPTSIKSKTLTTAPPVGALACSYQVVPPCSNLRRGTIDQQGNVSATVTTQRLRLIDRLLQLLPKKEELARPNLFTHCKHHMIRPRPTTKEDCHLDDALNEAALVWPENFHFEEMLRDRLTLTFVTVESNVEDVYLHD